MLENQPISSTKDYFAGRVDMLTPFRRMTSHHSDSALFFRLSSTSKCILCTRVLRDLLANRNSSFPGGIPYERSRGHPPCLALCTGYKCMHARSFIILASNVQHPSAFHWHKRTLSLYKRSNTQLLFLSET